MYALQALAIKFSAVTGMVFALCGASLAAIGAPSSNQTSRFRVTNQCEKTVWIQQDYKHPTNDAVVIKIPSGQAYDYNIPDKGLASTRFWPKTDCNEHGYQCRLGESTSVPQALDNGWQKGPFAPDINSKFEATWGCVGAIFNHNPGLCAKNPSAPGHTLGPETWWNGSAVDGYTLPYAIKVKKHNNSCLDLHSEKILTSPGVNCAGLTADFCPSRANLSSEGRFTKINGLDVTSINLQWKDQSTGKPIGCFSPCAKLTTAQGSENGTSNGGLKHVLGGLNPESPAANQYCCPTPPVTPGQCSAGPAARSAYANSVSVSQRCNAYTYAYDDAKGLARCAGQTQFEVIFCPKPGQEPAPPVPLESDPQPTPPQSSTNYDMQFNLNPHVGITALLNDRQLNNAEVLSASSHPSSSILKAIQGVKSANCQLTITKDTLTKGQGAFCLRLNIVKEASGKVHIYLPADIPDMGISLVSPNKSIEFGINNDMFVTFNHQVISNGDKIKLDDFAQNQTLELVANHQGTNASCQIKKQTQQLSIVPNSGSLCGQGLVLHNKDSGDYFIGLPTQLAQAPSGTGTSFQLGIAQGMQISAGDQHIAWNGTNKTLLLPSGVSQLVIQGQNKSIRQCPINNASGTLSWPNNAACQGLVVAGGVLYFPAF